jgi:hypothetical protein
MEAGCVRLFEYAVRQVTPADVVQYAPDDPGYSDYVREWTRIVDSREVPSESNFELTETIGLTRWADAQRETDPRRFRWFRALTNSVGGVLLVADLVAEELMPANYVAINLIDDAIALDDRELFERTGMAFDELHEVLRARKIGGGAFPRPRADPGWSVNRCAAA